VKKLMGTRHDESWRIAAIDGAQLKLSSPRNAGKKPVPLEPGATTVNVKGLLLQSDVGRFVMLETSVDVTFEAKPGVEYVAKGEFGREFAQVWIEDKASGERVSETAQGAIKGDTTIWCAGEYTCSQIEEKNRKAKSEQEAGGG
jgi:hypothetical protein